MTNKRNFEQVKSEFSKINQLNPKEKYRKFKELSFKLEIHDQLSLEEIELYKQVIESAKKIVGFPGSLNKKLQQLSGLRLKHLGIKLEDLKTILKINFDITLNTAVVGLADKLYFSLNINDHMKEVALLISQGKCLFFSTGYDGIVKIQVRVVNLEYPVFSVKEQKTLLGCSETLDLDMPTGTLVIGDYISDIPQKVIEIPPGQYRVCFNLDKGENYIICMAKITSENRQITNNPEIPHIEY
jgi:hypothetical protein